MEPFIGMIMIVGFNFAPKDWAYCQGQLMSIAQNSALFSLLGTTYGGNGTTTFGLPDLRGRAPIGVGQAPGGSNYIIGQIGGSETVTLLIPQMPMHNHTAAASGGSVAQPATAQPGTTNTPASTLAPAAVPNVVIGPNNYPVKAYGTPDGTTTLSPATFNTTITVGFSGGNQPHDNMMPYLAANYVIALYGIFPSRN